MTINRSAAAMQQHQSWVDRQAHDIARAGLPDQTHKNAQDITRPMTEMIPAQRGYEANGKVIQTQDALLGTLLDLVG